MLYRSSPTFEEEFRCALSINMGDNKNCDADSSYLISKLSFCMERLAWRDIDSALTSRVEPHGGWTDEPFWRRYYTLDPDKVTREKLTSHTLSFNPIPPLLLL
ncbi:hypothetical protein J6590_004549 [Homalodisca vitripennis]|nr:hypothetical protein J6590_004549 [Homalodisca vitripennis]